MRFNIFQAKKGLLGKRKWYWNLRAGNGEIVAQSEGYTRKRSALDTIRAIRNAKLEYE